MLDSLFDSENTITAAFDTKSQTNTSGTLGAITWTPSKTVTGIFWRGSLSKNLISEKFRADVVGVLLLRPSDIAISEIPKNGRVTITDGTVSVGVFAIVYPDDIGIQNQVIIVQLKEA